MTAPSVPSLPPENLPLRGGERLDQKTFHALYEQMPAHVKAELIGGVVYMPSPLSLDHGDFHLAVCTWAGVYQAATPGIRSSDNASVILGASSEPQPDVSMRVLPEHGGQTRRSADGFIDGAPELLVEVAVSSIRYDLHTKRQDYEALGVQEYVVVLVNEERVVWFVRRGAAFAELAAGADGTYRSEVFPGLWLDSAALFRLDTARLLAVLQQGTASPEHAAFVQRLARP